MTTYLVFVNVIVNFYELGYTISVPWALSFKFRHIESFIHTTFESKYVVVFDPDRRNPWGTVLMYSYLYKQSDSGHVFTKHHVTISLI